MLAELAGDWGLLLFRAAWAVLFGLLTLVWTDLSPTGLAILFATYTSVDGIATSIVAVGTRGDPGFARLLFDGLVRVGIGIVVFVMPAVMSRHLPALFAVFAARAHWRVAAPGCRRAVADCRRPAGARRPIATARRGVDPRSLHHRIRVRRHGVRHQAVAARPRNGQGLTR
jgi:hypothetical protein